MGQRSDQLSSFIGETPLYPITNINPNKNVKVFAKLEWQQFGSSVKARPAYRIVRDAIQRGDLTPEKHLLDASSGNTGIAYAHIGAALGIPVTLCLPENASEERKQILKALGVNIKYTSRTGSTDEAQEIAQKLYEENPEKYYYADQYSNPSNWKSHYYTTAPEILEQSGYEVTHFVAGLGTTGTFTGTGRRLKEYDEDIELIGLQPDLAMHGLEGWKHLETAHTPGIYDDSVADQMRTISTERSHDIVKRAAREEGLLISPSSAANLAGALEIAQELDEGVVVTIFPDDGSKYGQVINQLFKGQ
ncbi:cysteine synthase family protein [Aliifodinibius sp. S!AR15-10]|uniref:PLP-dependent cysteine synthase family protein n=1 Tax=Aliifodinibius sp. S!AR15-10 TaxID=2950437 RepID=UPI0028708116|nr:cysteine synthase family protein [Aliifodinibius sp. S!AR15-10]